MISVVIPFYKGERYVSKAVASILTQPYKDIELILVNDGSPTGEEVCTALAEKDSRIIYVHKKNEGIGATRNFGLSIAKGEYISFLDQDDMWVDSFLTQETVDSLTGEEIVCFSHYCTNESMTRGNKIGFTSHRIQGGVEAAKSAWIHHSSAFFQRKFLVDNNIAYGSARHEDVIFLQKAFYLSSSVRLDNKLFFLYRNNPKSETHSKKKPEEIYVPLLESWHDLLVWHEKYHSMDTEIIIHTKHMICVFAIEGLELLYQSGRDEGELKKIAEIGFEPFLDNYTINVSSAPWQVKRISRYFNEYKLS